METGGSPPAGPPPSLRLAWLLLALLLVLFPLGGLVLLVVPQPWKAVLLFFLVVLCLVLVGQLVWRSRSGRK